MQRRQPLQRTGTPRRATPLTSRTRLTPGPGLARAGRLKPVSDRRQAENRTRRQVVQALAADVEAAGCCPAAEAFPLVPCGGPVDAHEPLSRARGGSAVDPANIRLLCRQHHDHIHHVDPDGAEKAGWLVHSWDADRVVPP
ncbi:hypothetical protein MXD63_14820 [Frankia sp. Cpl3]|nr:hypothetical protein [Frankia sp. Cpl3]